MDLKKILEEIEEKRDWIINEGIKFNRLTKRLIYNVLKENWEEANKILTELEGKYKKLKDFVKKNPRFYNNFLNNEQEYVEALAFYKYIREGRILEYNEIDVDPISYVNGISDFCGELLRKSVEEMIKGNIDFALKAKETIEKIYKYLLDLELKQYELRRKIDYVANVLNKLIEFIFQKLR